MATMTLQQQVEKIARGRGSRSQRLEDLVYMLGLPVQEALRALDVYKPVRKARTPIENFTFGVEIECYNVNQSLLIEKLTAKGINIRCEGYNHNDSEEYYKIVSDGSLIGNNACEVVSPILKGQKGLESLEIVCDALNEIGANVNRSCGLHIHFGAQSFDIKRWQNIYVNYSRLENIIDSFMPASRRANTNCFCRSIALQPRLETTILHCHSVDDIIRFFGSRYFKINAEAYNRHHTVEFRQHSGTVDFKKVSMWLSFLKKMLTYSKNNTVENCTTIDDVPFLSKTEKDYFKQRINQLAA